MRRQAAAQQQHLVFGGGASLQLRVIALEHPPHRHLLKVHVSARLESGRQHLKYLDRIAPLDWNERMFEPAQSAHYVAAASSLPSGALDGHHCQPS